MMIKIFKNGSKFNKIWRRKSTSLLVKVKGKRKNEPIDTVDRWEGRLLMTLRHTGKKKQETLKCFNKRRTEKNFPAHSSSNEAAKEGDLPISLSTSVSEISGHSSMCAIGNLILASKFFRISCPSPSSKYCRESEFGESLIYLSKEIGAVLLKTWCAVQCTKVKTRSIDDRSLLIEFLKNFTEFLEKQITGFSRTVD